MNIDRLLVLVDQYVEAKVNAMLAEHLNTGLQQYRENHEAELAKSKIEAVVKGRVEIDCPECYCDKVVLNGDGMFETDCPTCNRIDSKEIAMKEF